MSAKKAKKAEEMKEKAKGEKEVLKEETSRPKKCEEELRECLDKMKELEEYAKRSKAALENLRKEKDTEVRSASNYANLKLVERLIEVLDDMERLIKHFGDRKSLEFEALSLVYKKFKDILSSEGLKEIETSGKFDPFDHEAVERIESEELPDWEIVEVVQRGYKFRSRIIRPARVKVAMHVEKPMTSGEKLEEKKENGKDGD